MARMCQSILLRGIEFLRSTGVTPRYQDNEADQVTLHGRRSLAAVAAAIRNPGLSERRFRSNIAVDGLEVWEEQGWMSERFV